MTVRFDGRDITALDPRKVTTLAWGIGAIVQVRPWREPQYIIPIAGML
jgi:ABC-type iron transport system FetAB permease component